jgi:archaellum component FlaC
MDEEDSEIEALEKEVDILARKKNVSRRRRELIAESITDAVKEMIMSVLRLIDEISFLGRVFAKKPGSKPRSPPPPPGGQHE